MKTNRIAWMFFLGLTAGLWITGCATSQPPAMEQAPAPGIGGIIESNAANPLHFTGTVVDAAGRPVAGAAVDFYQQKPGLDAGMEIKRRAVTGTNGAFAAWVPRQSTVLLARKPGLAHAWRQWSPGSPRDPESRLVLTPPSPLAGVVLDESNLPVAGAEVFAIMTVVELQIDDEQTSYEYLSGKPSRDCYSTRTGPDGKFRIEGFPTNATMDLVVSQPGKIMREPQREYIGPDTMQYRAGQLDAKVVVEPAGRIEGRVVTADGSPLPSGTRLSLRSGRSSAFREMDPVLADASGRFAFPSVSPGSFRIGATFGTNAVPDWVADPVEVEVEAEQTLREVQITAVRGGLLQVAVLGKDDRQPVIGANVYASRGTFSLGQATESDGTAILRLPPGDYRVSAIRDNSPPAAASATVRAGLTNRIEIELEPSPKITGVVRDPSGAPVPGMELELYHGYSSQTVKTDAEGRYDIQWNPQQSGGQGGAPFLIARDEKSGLALSQEIEEGTTTLELKLVPGLIVTGQVTRENGQPITNATLRLYLWRGNMGTSYGKPPRTDAQGRFEIRALPPGRRFSMDANAKGFGSDNRQIQEDDSTNRIELEPFVLKVADRPLAGQVLDAEEKPVASASVYIYGEGQPQTNVRTDKDGRFKFDAVCEGPIQVSASSQRSYGSASAQGGDTNVVLRLGQSSSSPEEEAPRRVSLQGKPLPDVAALGLAAETVPAGKPVLLCLFDVEQRPSRHFARTLNGQLKALQAKGLAIAGVQAAVIGDEAFAAWKDSNPAGFPVGRVAEKTAATKWASDAGSLPWLILTDQDHRVLAEGFALEELEAKLKELGK